MCISVLIEIQRHVFTSRIRYRPHGAKRHSPFSSLRRHRGGFHLNHRRTGGSPQAALFGGCNRHTVQTKSSALHKGSARTFKPVTRYDNITNA
jgi:hypothetical protein